MYIMLEHRFLRIVITGKGKKEKTTQAVKATPHIN